MGAHMLLKLVVPGKTRHNPSQDIQLVCSNDNEFGGGLGGRRLCHRPWSSLDSGKSVVFSWAPEH